MYYLLLHFDDIHFSMFTPIKRAWTEKNNNRLMNVRLRRERFSEVDLDQT